MKINYINTKQIKKNNSQNITISFVGCGFSTNSILFHLNKKLNLSSNIYLKKINIIDHCPINDFGKGVYRDTNKNVFLNTPIYRGTISKEVKFSFKNWIKNKDLTDHLDVGRYSPRYYFGLYLYEIFTDTINSLRKKGIEVNLVKGYVYDIIKDNPNNYKITGSFENEILSDKIILACGASFEDKILDTNEVKKFKQKKILIVGSGLSFLDVFSNVPLLENEVYFCSKNGFFPKIRCEKRHNHDNLYRRLLKERVITIRKLNEIVSNHIGANFFSYLKKNLISCNNPSDIERELYNEDPVVSIFTGCHCLVDLWAKFDLQLKKLFIRNYNIFRSYRSPTYKKIAKNLVDKLNSKALKYIDKFVISSYIKADKVIITFNDNSTLFFDNIIYCNGVKNKIEESLLFKNLFYKKLISKNDIGNGVHVCDKTLKTKDPNIYCIGNATFGCFMHLLSVPVLSKLSIRVSESILND